MSESGYGFLASQGRGEDELREVHEQVMQKLAPVRWLVKDGRPVPGVKREAKRLLKAKNANPPQEYARNGDWRSRMGWG